MKCQPLFSRENKKNILRVLDTLGRFSAIFCKGDNFCDFLLTSCTSSPSEGCPRGANSFLLE